MTTLMQIMSEVLRIDQSKITSETSIHSISTWNSLSHIELVVMLEETFKIQLTEDEIVAMRSVGEIQQVLVKRGVNVG